MQKDLESIEKAGIQIVGVSYDSPAVLKKFTDASKITFPLLSDPESETIDAYHIKNAEAKGKAVGIPHPGTFIIDSKGVIRAKLFLDNFRERHSTEELIKAAKEVD